MEKVVKLLYLVNAWCPYTIPSEKKNIILLSVNQFRTTHHNVGSKMKQSQ